MPCEYIPAPYSALLPKIEEYPIYANWITLIAPPNIPWFPLKTLFLILLLPQVKAEAPIVPVKLDPLFIGMNTK
jgi:hypothetical protein